MNENEKREFSVLFYFIWIREDAEVVELGRVEKTETSQMSIRYTIFFIPRISYQRIQIKLSFLTTFVSTLHMLTTLSGRSQEFLS